MDGPHLSQLLDSAAARHANRPAVANDHGATLSYRALAHAADRLAARLARWGVARGDRVGLFLPKRLEAVAAIHGILRAGAAYVPVDPTAPALRAAAILADGGVKTVVVAAHLADDFRRHWPGPGPSPRLIVVADDGASTRALTAADADWSEILDDDAPSPLPPSRDPNDLAYILYTSGSTGTPKGVMLSHANAFTFLDWCDQTFDVRPGDRVASHRDRFIMTCRSLISSPQAVSCAPRRSF